VKDRFWRECQLVNVIEGPVTSALGQELWKRMPDAPPEVIKEHLDDMMAEFEDEFRHADHAADRDAMTRAAELAHNRKVFAEAITSVAPRWNLDPQFFIERYSKFDTLYNIHGTLGSLPAPAGR
jgi:hypothetical protein